MYERTPGEKVERTVYAVTGNRLVDGRVVYLRADGTWSPSFEDAQLIADPAERDARLSWAQANFSTEVTGIYAFEVGLTAKGAWVLSARERLRALGAEETRRRLGYAP